MILKPRVASQQAMATIRSMPDAVVELVTNSDDSYRKIEKDWKEKQAVIRIFVHRLKGGKCKELKVIDFAAGMTKDELEKALEFGGETSGFEAGHSVRGLFGKGLKEVIISLREGEIYTIKHNKLSAVKMWFDKGITQYSDIESCDASEEIRKEIGLRHGSGTVVKIHVRNDKISMPDYKTFRPQIENHYALRDIISSPIRNIWLEFQSDKGKKWESKLKPPFPEGELVFDKKVVLPKYGDEMHIRVFKSKQPLVSPRNNPFGQAGLLIKTEGAILDNRLFKYESEPAALYFFGEVLCGGIANRIREDFKEHGGTGLIDPNRSGIAWQHEYCQYIQNTVEKILAPFIQQKKDELEKGIERKKVPQSVQKMLRKLCSSLNRFAKDELVEPQVKLDLSDIDELTIKPEIANIDVNKPRSFTIYAPQELINLLKVRTAIVESDNLNIQCLTKEVSLTIDPESSTLYHSTFQVVGRVFGEKAILSAKLGESETALAQVTVAPSKPKGRKGKKPMIRRGGFVENIVPDVSNNPSQRVLYKDGVITIYVKFPIVAKYLDSGLNGAETLEGRTILAELVGEAFCRTVAIERIKNGKPTPLPGAEIYTFNDVVNELQRKYLHKIHDVIAVWKFEK